MKLGRIVATVVSVAVLAGGIDAVAAKASGRPDLIDPKPVASSPAPPVEPNTNASWEGAPQTPSQRDAAATRRRKNPQKISIDGMTMSSRSERETVWSSGRGHHVSRITTIPTATQVDGQWKPIDLRLHPKGDSFEPAVSPEATTIASRTGGAVANVPVDGQVLSLGVEGLTPEVSAAVDGPRATFKDALGAVDVVVEPRPDGAKTTYVLPTRDDADREIVETVDLPDGWTAQQVDDGIELRDATGTPRNDWRGGPAFGANGGPVPGVVTLQLLSTDDGIARARVVTATEFLDTAAFPVRLDPALTIRRTNEANAGDTWVRDGNPSQNAWSNPYLYAGRHPVYGDRWRSLLTFQPNLPANAEVVDATMQILESNDNRTPTGDLYADRNTTGWGPSTTWSNAPSFTDRTNGGSAHLDPADTGDDLIYLDLTTYTDAWHAYQNNMLDPKVPNFGVTLYSSGENICVTDCFEAFHSGEVAPNGQIYAPELWIEWNEAPPPPTMTSPAVDTTVLTTTPRLQASTNAVTVPSGYTLKRFFSVATGPDGDSGQVVSSGWLTGAVDWTPPDGALDDGATYYWTVWEGFFASGATSPTGTSRLQPARKFKVDSRLGASGPSPMDAYGPVAVNLATGNMTTSVSLLDHATALAGGMGINLTYNSQAASKRGLMGEYYTDWSLDHLFNEPMVMRRRDNDVNFDWGLDSPTPALDEDSDTPGDHFMVRWTGYITVPSTGSWYVGAVQDDGVRIWIDNTLGLDNWNNQGVNGIKWPAQGMTLSAGQHTIKVEYYDETSAATVSLWAKLGASGAANRVDTTWLSTDMDTVSRGWTASVDLDGSLRFVSLTDNGSSVVLRTADGTTSEFKTTGSGFTNPPGEEGVLSRNADGTLSFQDVDGLTYAFTKEGALQSAVSGLDDTKPAALQYSWTSVDPGSPPRLTKIKDPVTSRETTLMYNTQNGNCVTFTPPTGTVQGPKGALCGLVFGQGGGTIEVGLYYDSSNPGAQLRKIVEYGGQDQITDFGYSGGYLTTIRSTLGYDAIRVGKATDTNVSTTEIAYDSSTPKRVTTVTMPEPTQGAARPQRTYSTGLSGATVRELQSAGVTKLLRTVDSDSAGRLTHQVDAAGVNTYSYWNSDDQVAAAKDGAGLMTATEFDYAKRPIKQHGPAPSNCFAVTAPYLPNGQCAVPNSQTTYDDGLKGLAAEYWTNRDLAGPSSLHALGVNSLGTLDAYWADGTGPCTNPYAGGVSVCLKDTSGTLVHNNWSARFTGEVYLNHADTWTFWANSDDGVRIYVDDKLVSERWQDQDTTASLPPVATASTSGAGWHRIRVDYYDATSKGALQLWYNSISGGNAVVPGTNLRPRYGLPVWTTDADGLTTFTDYGTEPELGLVRSTITDPNGLRLADWTNYERRDDPANPEGYLRRTARFTPKGTETGGNVNDFQYGYSYYKSSDAAASTCPDTSATGQRGQLKSTTSADSTHLVRQYAYNYYGQQIGIKVGSSAWACSTFDGRHRPATVTDSSGKTTTYDYHDPGTANQDPFTTTVSYTDSAGAPRSTLQTADLLGRPTAYKDEQGTTTTTHYDLRSRPDIKYRALLGAAPPGPQLETFAYDATNGRLISSTEYASGSGRTTNYAYDAAGRPSTTTLPNGVVTTTTYDPNRGDVTGLSHAKSPTTFATWTYSKNNSRMIISESEAVTGRQRAYTYDAAHRLKKVQAGVGGTTLANYSYDANSNRCGNGTACDSSWTYDEGDRILTSPYASAYTYDSHGNMTSAAMTATNPSGSITDNGVAFDTAPATAAKNYAFTAGQAGTVSATATPTASTPTYSTASASGSIAPSGSWPTTIPAYGVSYIRAAVTWTQATGGYAPVTINLKKGTTTLATVNGSGGSALLTYPFTDSTYSGNLTLEVVNQSSTLNVPSITAAWGSTTTQAQTTSGAIAAGGVLPQSVTAAGNGYISSSATYTQGTRTASASYSPTIGMGATATQAITVDDVGTVTASLDWANAPSYGSSSPSGTLGLAGSGTSSASFNVPVRGSSFVRADLSYTTSGTGFANVSLTLLDNNNAPVASTSSTNGSAHLGVRTAYVGQMFTLKVVNNSPDKLVPSFSLPWSYTTIQTTTATRSTPINPGGGVWNSPLTITTQGAVNPSFGYTQGLHSVPTTDSGSVTESSRVTSIPVQVDGPGTVTGSLDWSGATHAITKTGKTGIGTTSSPDYQWATFTTNSNGAINMRLDWTPLIAALGPDLSFDLLDDANNVLATSSRTNSATNGFWESLSYTPPADPTPFTAHTYRLRVTNTTAAQQDFTISGSYPVLANLDMELRDPFGTLVAWSSNTATGKPETLSATLDSLAPTGLYRLFVSSQDFGAAFSLNASSPRVAYAPVTAQLKNSSGTPVASATGVGGVVQFDYVAAPGNYTVELINNATDIPIPWAMLDAANPVVRAADIDLELWGGPSNTRVAYTSGTTKPDSLTYAVPAGQAGTYTLKMISRDFDTSGSLTVSWPQKAWASLIPRVKNSSGTIVATGTAANGTAFVEYPAPSAGSYTVEYANASSDTPVPSLSATTQVPQSRTGQVTLTLQDSTGAVIATGTGNQPNTLIKSVSAGAYTLVATPATGKGTVNIAGSYPGRPVKQTITYDANEHATSVDDGTTKVSETLSPSGRVIRRTVTDSATNAVAEDVLMGYGDGGDSPAYTRPVAGGAVTTYLGGSIDVAGTVTYQHANLHGDIVGTTNSAGVWTAVPLADEYGVNSAPPATRLGWLGAAQRPTVGASNLYRMGVRLYDPALGRFTSVDSVEGGSCNDYEYVCGDPTNGFDLLGTAQTCSNNARLCSRYRALRGNIARQVWFNFSAGDLSRLRSLVKNGSLSAMGLDWGTDSCSTLGGKTMNGLNLGAFGNACGRHDFGYRNSAKIFGRRSESDRFKIDNRLYWDMFAHCRSFGVIASGRFGFCAGTAAITYTGVRAGGWVGYGK
jgi:RHS repeat-associated protein